MGYCTICGNPAQLGVYCDNCRKKLENRVNKGLVVTKPAIISHLDRRQASGPPSRTRPSLVPGSRTSPPGTGRASGKGIAIGKDGLPMYCDACGNLLHRDGDGFACRACGRVSKGAGP